MASSEAVCRQQEITASPCSLHSVRGLSGELHGCHQKWVCHMEQICCTGRELTVNSVHCFEPKCTWWVGFPSQNQDSHICGKNNSKAKEAGNQCYPLQPVKVYICTEIPAFFQPFIFLRETASWKSHTSLNHRIFQGGKDLHDHQAQPPTWCTKSHH